jgi:spore coat polysaccharide biosynthesis protein SpsF
VTGDCPLIDYDICDRLIDFYEHQKADYASLAPEFAEGLDCEVFSFESLEKANSNAKLKSEREHVTIYIKKHTEIFNMKYIGNIDDDSCYRITVDNEEDFCVVKSIIEHFQANPTAPWLSVRDFLKIHPDIMAKNSHIERNEGLRLSIEQDKKLRVL